MYKKYLYVFVGCALTLAVAGCDGKNVETVYPQDSELRRKEARGKLSGDGINIFGRDDDKASGASGIGVNALLWRASLDTVSFMPLSSADPFGGVILTDWYEDPKTPSERYKINVLILDKELRADGVKVKAFKQTKASSGIWQDAPIADNVARDMENTILTRARELKVQQLQK